MHVMSLKAAADKGQIVIKDAQSYCRSLALTQVDDHLRTWSPTVVRASMVCDTVDEKFVKPFNNMLMFGTINEATTSGLKQQTIALVPHYDELVALTEQLRAAWSSASKASGILAPPP